MQSKPWKGGITIKNIKLPCNQNPERVALLLKTSNHYVIKTLKGWHYFTSFIKIKQIFVLKWYIKFP